MRLRTCVAIELAAGATFAAAAGITGAWGARRLGDWQRSAPLPALADMRAAPTLSAPLETPTHIGPVSAPFGLFQGIGDELLLAPLRDSPITRAKPNRGGSSISMRLDFADGARAAFKPQQTNLQTVPRKEIAAYRINRLLGLSSVAPAIGRRFAVKDLYAALPPQDTGYLSRLEAQMVVEDGKVIGELSWWIPVIEYATIDGQRLDSVQGVNIWSGYLTAGNPIPEQDESLVAQVSDMLLFDLIINNPDRWSGGNTRSSKDGSILYFMDNTLSFALEPQGSYAARTYLERCQKFSRSLVDALRALDVARVKASLEAARGPFEYLLTDDELADVFARRNFALRYIDGLVDRYGADAVLVFP